MSAPGPLAGRVALVTGASRGIGRAIALALAAPEDIAGAVRFLVSPAAEQVTGQRVAVDAGGLR